MATVDQSFTTLEDYFQKFRQYMKEFQSSMNGEFKQVMKKLGDLRASNEKALNIISELKITLPDHEEFEVAANESEGNDGLVISKVEASEGFLMEIDGLNSPIHQVCDQFIHEKVISTSHSNFSSPSLFTNTAVETIFADKKGSLVANNMFVKSSKRNGFSVELKPKPPDTYHSLNSLIMSGFNATTESKAKESLCQCLIRVTANNQQPSQVVCRDDVNWFSPYTMHGLDRQVVPHYFSGKLMNHTYMECWNHIAAKYMENYSCVVNWIQLVSSLHLAVHDFDALAVDINFDDITRILHFLDNWGIVNSCVAAQNLELRKEGSCFSKDSNGELRVSITPLKSIDNLILFLICLELSLAYLKALAKLSFSMGLTQVVFTILVQKMFGCKLKKGTHWGWTGDDAMELLEFALSLGGDFEAKCPASKLVKVESFNSTKKRMGVILELPEGGFRAHTTGASEIVLVACDKLINSNEIILRSSLEIFAMRLMRKVCNSNTLSRPDISYTWCLTLLMGVTFSFNCIAKAYSVHQFCGWRIKINGKESCCSQQICLIMLIFFTCAAANGCILPSVGQDEFHGKVLLILNYVVNQSDYTVQILRNVQVFLLLYVKDVSRIHERLDQGSVVILSSLSHSSSGEALNCNTYEVVTVCALDLGAEKLICIIYGSILDECDRLFRFLTIQDADTLICRSDKQSEIAATYVKVVGQENITSLSLGDFDIPSPLNGKGFSDNYTATFQNGVGFDNGNGLWTSEQGFVVGGQERLSSLNGYLSELDAAVFVCTSIVQGVHLTLIKRTDEDLFKTFDSFVVVERGSYHCFCCSVSFLKRQVW